MTFVEARPLQLQSAYPEDEFFGPNPQKGNNPMEQYQEKLLERGHLTLFGEIGEETIERLAEKFLFLSTAPTRRKRPKDITLWINSPGGLLQPTFALIDLLTQMKNDLMTVAMGTVESAAVLVLLAGTTGKRYITPHCSLMVHEYSWSNSGSYTEMNSRMREVRRTIDKQLDYMSERTGKSKTQLKKIVRHEETWLTPEEALEWGLVDKILERSEGRRRVRAK